MQPYVVYLILLRLSSKTQLLWLRHPDFQSKVQSTSEKTSAFISHNATWNVFIRPFNAHVFQTSQFAMCALKFIEDSLCSCRNNSGDVILCYQCDFFTLLINMIFITRSNLNNSLMFVFVIFVTG